MSFKEIKELRQSGKLEEALQMAKRALEEEPNNIWNKRAIAWVYYDYLKINSQAESFENFKENLLKIKELDFPETEKMIFDYCAWQIGKIVFGLQKVEPVDYDKINELFDIIKNFHFTKPSEGYSFIYKAFHKRYKDWSRYLEFADWWNFENFRSDDYHNEEYMGKKQISIAEQAYIAYCKKLLEGEPLDLKGQQRIIDKEKIELFLPKLDAIIEKHPVFLYPPYYKAKLLLELGSEANILSAFLPFAKQKRNDFWVWGLMAEIFSKEKEIQFACYCKALSLKTPDEFLVKIRQTFAEILIERKMYNEAKTEIQKIIEAREKNEWKFTNQILEWMEQDWYKSAKSKSDNNDLYSNYLKKAEDILFQDIPEELIAVEFVNENKFILNFVKDNHKFGYFKYQNFLNKPKVGDLLIVRFNGDGQNGYYKIFTAKKAEAHMTSDAIKNFEGYIKINDEKKFGFVDDIFVEPKLIQKNRLSDGQKIVGKAILSFDKIKNRMGWKAFEVDPTKSNFSPNI